MILADQAQQAKPFHDELLALLYPVIVLDTVNFSENADRARPLDREVCARIESGRPDLLSQRQTVYDQLVQARSDVSALDALQLLHKDMKLVHRDGDCVNIALPGMPIVLREFVKMPSAAENVMQLASEFECAVVVLLSMVIDAANVVHREVAVIRTANTEPAEDLYANILRLLQDRQSNLDLIKFADPNVDFLCGSFFTQGNVRSSRKQIMPIIQSVDKLDC